MGDDRKRLWRAYRWSNVDFSLKGGRAKGMKEGSIGIKNYPTMSGWHHFWENSQRNHRQTSMRSFARIKPRSWQCEKGTFTKIIRWIWKVTYAWIIEYFRLRCKSICYIQSNKEIWGEDERDTCGREDPTLAVKEVPLYGGHDRGATKNGFSFNSRSYGKVTSPWEKS